MLPIRKLLSHHLSVFVGLFLPQKEAGAETSSFYSALLRIQPQIVHCWRPMRRTFKAYDEGGTGLLSVADFRKVSSAVGCLRRPNGEQWPEDLKRGTPHPPPPGRGPGVSGCPGPHFLGTPKLSRATSTCPAPADPRFSSLKVSRTPWGHDLRAQVTTTGASAPWSPDWLHGGAGACVRPARPTEQAVTSRS